MRFARRLAYWLRFRARQQDLRDELALHHELLANDFERQGLSPDAARLAARRTMGNETYMREEARSVWLAFGFEAVLNDVRYAWRALLRSQKGSSALVVFTLALGIGSTAAVFGMVDDLLLRPLSGVHDDGRAAYLRLETAAGVEKSITTPELDEMRRTATLLGGIASYSFATFDASVGDVRGIRADAALIYGDYFELLGVRPAAGHLLRDPDTGFESDPLQAVISERMAEMLFRSVAGAVGQTMYLNNQRVTVAGVAGGGFSGSERNARVDVWLPLGAFGPLFGDRLDKLRGRSGAPHMFFIVRPRAAVGLGAASSQLEEIIRSLARAEPSYDRDARLATVQPILTPSLGLPPEVRASVEGTLRLLSGVVALVLLIACANVANLLLFRNVAQRGATVTRMALGASAVRIAREHFVQSVLLGALGAAAGIGTGWVLSILFRGQSLGGAPAFQGLPLDGRVALFAVLAAIGTAVVFGTVPASLAGRSDIASALRQTDVRHSRRMAVLRCALSSGQLALTLTLGVGALLLVRSVHKLNTANTGLDIRDIASLYLSHKVNMDRVQTDVLARRVIAAIETVPGVRDAAIGPSDLDAPYGGTARVAPPGVPPEQRVDVHIVPVTPDWFGIFRIAPTRGRVFREDDWKDRAPYDAVLTASLARKLFGAEDAVDRVLIGERGRAELHVIGVVPNLSGSRAPNVAKDVLFVTYDFPPPSSSELSVVLRSERFDARVAQSVRNALRAVLPDQPVEDPVPLSAASAHREQETLSQLLVLLSALAATLATVGLYGVIAFVVAGRRQEFAIRIALGAAGWRVAILVSRYAAVIVVLGALLGLGGAYVLSLALQNRLFEVGPLDPTSYVAGAALLVFVAVVACFVPAWRAVRLDPAATLREE